MASTVCSICRGKIPPTPPHKSGPKPKYCSLECAQEARKRIATEWQKEQRAKGRCPTCGQLKPIKRRTRLPIVE